MENQLIISCEGTTDVFNDASEKIGEFCVSWSVDGFLATDSTLVWPAMVFVFLFSMFLIWFVLFRSSTK